MVQNLEMSVTTRELHDTFVDFGEILACKVATDKDGKSKGYGFVHFSEPSAAKEAIEQVNGAQLGDSEQVVTVTEFISKQDRGDPKKRFTNVYVKNLPASVTTEEDLKKLFEGFGDISSVALSKVSPSTTDDLLTAPYVVASSIPNFIPGILGSANSSLTFIACRCPRRIIHASSLPSLTLKHMRLQLQRAKPYMTRRLRDLNSM